MLLDISYSHGDHNDIVFNKMTTNEFSTRNTEVDILLMLGEDVLTTTRSYRQLNNVIYNDMSEKDDIKSTNQSLYGKKR